MPPLGLSNSNVRLLGQSHISVPTNALVDTFLDSFLIPAGSMGLNGYLKITSFWTKVGGIAAAAPLVRFGNSNDLTGSIISSPTWNAGSLSGIIQTHLVNANSASIQHGSLLAPASSQLVHGYSMSVLAEPTYAINTLLDCYIVFSGAVANVLDTFSFDGYSIELSKT